MVASRLPRQGESTTSVTVRVSGPGLGNNGRLPSCRSRSATEFMTLLTEFPHLCKYITTESAVGTTEPIGSDPSCQTCSSVCNSPCHQEQIQSLRYEMRGTKAFVMSACIVLEALGPVCIRQRVLSRKGQINRRGDFSFVRPR